jgi:hypothetical protein
MNQHQVLHTAAFSSYSSGRRSALHNRGTDVARMNRGLRGGRRLAATARANDL